MTTRLSSSDAESVAVKHSVAFDFCWKETSPNKHKCVCVCACACIMRRSSVSCCPPNVFWLVWENLCRLTCSAQPGCLSRWAENQDVSKGHCSSPWHPHHHSTHPSTALASRGAQQQARIRLDFTGAGSQGSLLTFFLFLQERKCVNWWMKS